MNVKAITSSRVHYQYYLTIKYIKYISKVSREKTMIITFCSFPIVFSNLIPKAFYMLHLIENPTHNACNTLFSFSMIQNKY